MFVLAALGPTAQLAVFAGRLSLGSASGAPTTSRAVADHLNVVNGAFHTKHNNLTRWIIATKFSCQTDVLMQSNRGVLKFL